MKLFASLEGYRTYIMSALGAATVAGWFLGFIDDRTADIVLVLLGFGGLAALRASK